MKTLNTKQDSEHKIIDATEKLRPQPLPPLPAAEAAVIDTFIRHKRVEARAKARAKELSRTVLAILLQRKAVQRGGAYVRLKRDYDYNYSSTIAELEESVKLAKEMERKAGTAKADEKVTVAFEDVAAKTLKKASEVPQS